MFILNELLDPLQGEFSQTRQGQKRKYWFVYTLLAVMLPFTSSMTSNLLRTLKTLFGLEIESQRFYAFMGSTTLPWRKLWRTVWGLIPDPAVQGRIMVALDDSINPKTGKKIFGCASFHNHAAKNGQSSYPWSQCILAIGLLKKVKSRWVCMPLDFRFYHMEKEIEAKTINVKRKGKVVPFESKMEQASKMLKDVHEFYQEPVLAIADSWFGNDGLWSKLERGGQGKFNLLCRMRSNLTLFDFLPTPAKDEPRNAGRPRKYGVRLGSIDECALRYKDKAQAYKVNLYGKEREVSAYTQDVILKTMKCSVRIVWVFRRTRYIAIMTTDLSLSVEEMIEYYGARWKIEAGFKEIKQEIGSAKSQTRNAESVLNHLSFCMMATTVIWIYADKLQKAPDRKYKIRGRAGFAFSDVRRIISEAALDPHFQSICPVPRQRPQKSFVKMLLRMVA
ncbi:MAG: transposase [Deltaproteobacteria bacterium]|nr:transposase [Candidatus Desulfobacula maris]